MSQWLSMRLAGQQLISMVGFVLALRHELDVCSSFRLSREAFAQPMSSDWRLGTLVDYHAEGILLRQNVGNRAVWQSLRTPWILK